jgi:hypothetical protein
MTKKLLLVNLVNLVNNAGFDVRGGFVKTDLKQVFQFHFYPRPFPI